MPQLLPAGSDIPDPAAHYHICALHTGNPCSGTRVAATDEGNAVPLRLASRLQCRYETPRYLDLSFPDASFLCTLPSISVPPPPDEPRFHC
jgi:hypothetical protein